jgi:N-acetylglucosamine-6-phosphate deacetylase
VIRLAARAIPRLYAVTDATAATGMPDGEYGLGEQRVHKCGGCVPWRPVRWPAALTMDQALRNLVRVGLDWPTPRSVFPPSRPTTWAWTIAAASRPTPAPTWWCWTPNCACSRWWCGRVVD